MILSPTIMCKTDTTYMFIKNLCTQVTIALQKESFNLFAFSCKDIASLAVVTLHTDSSCAALNSFKWFGLRVNTNLPLPFGPRVNTNFIFSVPNIFIFLSISQERNENRDNVTKNGNGNKRYVLQRVAFFFWKRSVFVSFYAVFSSRKGLDFGTVAHFVVI